MRLSNVRPGGSSSSHSRVWPRRCTAGSLRQKYQLAQAKVKAEQDVAQATGQANALKAQAEGEASATLTRAKAQAEANKLLSQSLTPELIRYQQLQRWDGKLPLFSGGGVTPLIDATSIISGTAGR
jgi:regulator of protease activity HflC (stomatin/prohibitin superfamily)